MTRTQPLLQIVPDHIYEVRNAHCVYVGEKIAGAAFVSTRSTAIQLLEYNQAMKLSSVCACLLAERESYSEHQIPNQSEHQAKKR